MSHNMNPFDFVPFADEPMLKTIKEWFAVDNTLVSGYLNVRIKALTPMHIVGKQTIENKNKLEKSFFNRRNGKAIIPGSSIRGMLRHFVETACNGWASQITEEYAKEPNKRKYGFKVIDVESKTAEDQNKNKENLDLALNEKYAVPANPNKIDLASFLFGFVPMKEGKAFAGRLTIEDASIQSDQIGFDDQYFIPDLNSDAFMGGAHPSKSSWWYQKAQQIQVDNNIVEFIGLGYRGRKFFYHQNPAQCIQWYFDSDNWPIDLERELYKFYMECFKAQCLSNTFRIYFEDLPKKLISFILFALSPGNKILHHLGYGKAYGYGTVQLIIDSGKFRGYDFDSLDDIPIQNLINEIYNALWNETKLRNLAIGEYLHWPSITALSKIMWYEPDSNLLFTYPRFNDGYKVANEVLDNMKSNGIDQVIYTAFEKLNNCCMYSEKSFKQKLGRSATRRELKDELKKAMQCAKHLTSEFKTVVTQRKLDSVLNSDQQDEMKNNNNIYKIASETEAEQIATKMAQKKLRTALHFNVYQRMAENFIEVNSRKLENAK